MAGIRYAYPGGGTVLRGVDLRVDVGERVAVLGANGAGKSTLLQHVNGLLLPTVGTVRVNGVPVVEPSLHRVRSQVGLVFQEPDDQLFLPSLLEDVAFGPLNRGSEPAEAERLAREHLRRLGLEHAADRAAHHLSGGEKRLAALATVLVSHPPLLVLDEPTADLDARGRRRVVELLAGRRETLLIATHDLEAAAALCPRAVVLDRGTVAADGPSEGVLEDRDLLATCGLFDPLPRPAAAAERVS